MKVRNRTNFLFGYLAGIAASMVIIAIGNWVLTAMIISERIGEGSVICAVPALIMIATTIGILTNLRLQNKRRKHTPLIMTVIMFLLMLAGGLLLDGSYRGFGSNAAAIGAGGVVSYIFCLNKRADFRKHQRGYR